MDLYIKVAKLKKANIVLFCDNENSKKWIELVKTLSREKDTINSKRYEE